MAMSRSDGGTLLTTRSPIRILPPGDAFETRDHAQKRGFSTADGPTRTTNSHRLCRY